jgi:hypothetical protein
MVIWEGAAAPSQMTIRHYFRQSNDQSTRCTRFG